jgi:hypothetical protein
LPETLFLERIGVMAHSNRYSPEVRDRFTPKGAERQKKDQRALDLLSPGGHYVFSGWEDEYDGSCELFIQNGFARVQHHRWAYPYHFEDEEYIGGIMEGGETRQEAEAKLLQAKTEHDGLFRMWKEHLFIAQKPG